MPARRGQRYAGSMGRVNSAPSHRAASVVIVTAILLLMSALVPMASAMGTGQLRTIAAAVQRFLLFYSGVFALVGLTAAVGAGLLAADQVVMSPGHRIVTQAMHRALSILALAALFNHITFEIIAHRARAADAFVPFLAQRQMLFMGLGTIATDLFVIILHDRESCASGSPPGPGPGCGAPCTRSLTSPGRWRFCTGCWPAGRRSPMWTGATAAASRRSGWRWRIRCVAMMRGRQVGGRRAPDQFSPSMRAPSAMAAGRVRRARRPVRCRPGRARSARDRRSAPPGRWRPRPSSRRRRSRGRRSRGRRSRGRRSRGRRSRGRDARHQMPFRPALTTIRGSGSSRVRRTRGGPLAARPGPAD